MCMNKEKENDANVESMQIYMFVCVCVDGGIMKSAGVELHVLCV